MHAGCFFHTFPIPLPPPPPPQAALMEVDEHMNRSFYQFDPAPTRVEGQDTRLSKTPDYFL